MPLSRPDSESTLYVLVNNRPSGLVERTYCRLRETADRINRSSSSHVRVDEVPAYTFADVTFVPVDAIVDPNEIDELRFNQSQERAQVRQRMIDAGFTEEEIASLTTSS